MARRAITLALIGGGIATALFLFTRRASGAVQTLDLDTGQLLPGSQPGASWLLDEQREAPGIIESLEAIMEPGIHESISHLNVQAFLAMLGQFEGGPAGYNALFGGGTFSSFADHPRTLVRSSGYASTAAGRYQILERTWDDVRAAIGAPDFSPYWQDIAAVYLIRRRGALSDVVAGNFDAAIAKLGKEWASLPGSPYGQPMRTLEDARTVYADAGGGFA